MLTIKGTTYPAARYTEHLTISPGCRAYAEGKREYDREAFYVAGPLPACKRNGNVAFRVTGESDDWYVSGYFPHMNGRTQDDIGNPKYDSFLPYHPFGASWYMSPWDIKDSKIDSYERVPYKRVNVDVQAIA
jgi:hypothetical protein